MTAEAPKHFAHYVSRKITPFKKDRLARLADTNDETKQRWFDLVQAKDGGFDRPCKHVTRQDDHVTQSVKPGDAIWIFSQILYRDLAFPPSLDAKIIVAEPPYKQPVPWDKSKGRTVFEAGSASFWHLLSDWRGALQATQLSFRNAPPAGVFEKHDHVGKALQSMKEILDPAPLLDRERELKEYGYYRFISYRHKDGLPLAARAVSDALMSENAQIWWDRWSLPRRLAEGRELLNNKALEQHIEKKARHAASVIGIETRGYNEPGAFTDKERAWARVYEKREG